MSGLGAEIAAVKRTPTPLHPGSQMHAGVPVALLQYPAPHDLVSGAVIQASQAEDAFALAFAIVGGGRALRRLAPHPGFGVG